MSGSDLSQAAQEAKVRRQRDVGTLPEAVKEKAKFSGSEVMWPRASAHDAIDSLAGQGNIILGLDLRRYEDDGRLYEAPWSAFEPTGSGDVEAGNNDALAALLRPNISQMDGHDWVLITWD